MKNSVFSNFDCAPEIKMKWLQHYGNLRWISPRKTLWSTFFSKKKKIPSDIPKWSFIDFEIEPTTPFGNRKFFFLKISLTRIVFWGEIYRELPCRWDQYIIIMGSRSKIEKTMKNSVFSNFDCDTEIMLKWLQDHGNLQWLSPQKTLGLPFFPEKKKNSVRHPKMVVYRFWDRT